MAELTLKHVCFGTPAALAAAKYSIDLSHLDDEATGGPPAWFRSSRVARFMEAACLSKWYIPGLRRWVSIGRLVSENRNAFIEQQHARPTHVLLPRLLGTIAAEHGVMPTQLRFFGMKVMYGLPWFQCVSLPAAGEIW